MLSSVISFPSVPDTVNVVTVWVDPAVESIEWASLPSSLKSLKVLLPEMVFEAVEAPRENQMLL